MIDNMTSGNSKIDLSYSGSNLGSTMTGSNSGSNMTGSYQTNNGLTKRSIVPSNNVRKIANNFEPAESPRKLNDMHSKVSHSYVRKVKTQVGQSFLLSKCSMLT